MVRLQHPPPLPTMIDPNTTQYDDEDFDDPLPERPESCNMDEGCESCQ